MKIVYNKTLSAHTKELMPINKIIKIKKFFNNRLNNQNQDQIKIMLRILFNNNNR